MIPNPQDSRHNDHSRVIKLVCGVLFTHQTHTYLLKISSLIILVSVIPKAQSSRLTRLQHTEHHQSSRTTSLAMIARNIAVLLEGGLQPPKHSHRPFSSASRTQSKCHIGRYTWKDPTSTDSVRLGDFQSAQLWRHTSPVIALRHREAETDLWRSG